MMLGSRALGIWSFAWRRLRCQQPGRMKYSRRQDELWHLLQWVTVEVSWIPPS